MASGAIPISKFIERKIYAINKNLPSFVLPAITDFNEIKTIDVGACSTEKYLLYCGNLGYIDVINFIFEAFSKIENINIKLLLVVNGKKNQFEELDKLIEKWKIESDVIIKTNLSFQSLIIAYKNAIGLLIPLRNKDQDLARFPHKISEYTATKRPIITMGFGVINDYFDKTSAYICSEYSTLEYAKIIDSLIDNPLDAIKIGIKGHEVGKKFLNTKSYNKTLAEFLLKI
jgi:glycosyltransferase involved in cell wall biosynthesis